MDRSTWSSHAEFRISPIDRLGRRIDSSVLAAAEEIGRRAIGHAEKLFVDPAVAATLLEEAAATVSRAIHLKRERAQSEIRDLRSYLFRAFIRRLNRTQKRQMMQRFEEGTQLPADGQSPHFPSGVELKILVDELLTKCDAVTRDMFYRRLQGFAWKEIGSSYGITADAAKSRFSQSLRRVAERLKRDHDLHSGQH